MRAHTEGIATVHDQCHAIDFAPNVGHSTVRAQVIGNAYERIATPQ
ncbi:MAG: hypothetical protein OXU69_07580 [Gemmatimonadota bacterium]|nr:hypothetical protein [Gemmatimonadota bacterium]MDE2984552.1 hypothetical protein [Gemmatimonadota bacterium]